MANNHYKHKDYSGLLKELQQSNNSESFKDTDVLNDVNISYSTTSEKLLDLDYDLNKLLSYGKDLQELTVLYKLCEEQLEKEQQITQDLLHAIEFTTSYKKRNKFTTQLHYNRCRRRYYKNTMIVLKPIIELLQKEETKKTFNRLSNLLGEARKTKAHINDKSYSPRILTEIGVISNGNKK